MGVKPVLNLMFMRTKIEKCVDEFIFLVTDHVRLSEIDFCP